MDGYILIHSKDVCHYGTKGQKWGVRKYQNEDGSLTPLGYEHYGVNKKDISKKEQKKYLNKSGKLNSEGRNYYENMRAEAKAKLKKEKNQNPWDEFRRQNKAERAGLAVGIATKNPLAGVSMGHKIGVIDNLRRQTISKLIIKHNEKKLKRAETVLKRFGNQKVAKLGGK